MLEWNRNGISGSTKIFVLLWESRLPSVHRTKSKVWNTSLLYLLFPFQSYFLTPLWFYAPTIRGLSFDWDSAAFQVRHWKGTRPLQCHCEQCGGIFMLLWEEIPVWYTNKRTFQRNKNWGRSEGKILRWTKPSFQFQMNWWGHPCLINSYF